MATTIQDEFLPSATVSSEKLREQVTLFRESGLYSQLLDSVSDLLLVLNRKRQIIYANQAILDLVQADSMDQLLGLRPGDALQCRASITGGHACGSGSSCRFCGSVLAIIDSIDDKDAKRECFITSDISNPVDHLELKVQTSRLACGPDEFVVWTAVDLSDFNRRQIMERIFFHDVLNTLGGLRGYLKLLPSATGAEKAEFIDIAEGLADQLLEEIIAHRDLLAAEKEQLEVTPRNLHSVDLLAQLQARYLKDDLSFDRRIVIDSSSDRTAFRSDPIILKRVVGNMLKNALEATLPGEVVTLGCRTGTGEIRFWTHNPNPMVEEAVHSVFKRSFSTKSQARGLGTYSIKLLTTQHLGGRVDFSTSTQTGTTFTVTLPLDSEAVLEN